VALEALEVRGPEDFEAAFATARQRNAQALLALEDFITVSYRSRITAVAATSRLPGMYGGPDVLRAEHRPPLPAGYHLRGQGRNSPTPPPAHRRCDGLTPER